MRIAFLLWKDVRHADGPLRKIVRQIHLWTEAGHDVCLFNLGPGDHIWHGASDISVKLYRYGSLISRLAQARRLTNDVLAWKPDLVFFRLSVYYPPLGLLLKRLPVVLDLNSNDLTENKEVLTPAQFLYYRLTRNIFLKQAAGFTPASHELADFYARYDKPMVVISNGIELGEIIPFGPPDNVRPKLFFIGSTFNSRPQPWHGVDKIIKLAQQQPEWDFEVVGPTPAQLPSPLPPNVTAHGFLSQNEYNKFLSQADVAIGSLALHRISLNESSSLKVREYLAYGIPTVVGCRDTDFSPPPEFVLQLPNSSDSIEKSLPELREFVERWRGRRIDRRQVLCLDMSVKEGKRLELFHRLAEATSAQE